ncbi:MAG: uracil-DNA glycosylase [Deltaproteobacteria bacterium]|nr:uracil-DNA glycosylase [Deltaproteobacteria bacterium]
MASIQNDLGDCKRCKLSTCRTNIVFGEGSPTAKLMFIGEGPGEQEDRSGRPFVGKAGELLDKIIEAMGFKRSEVYIANVVKCRPPENRAPENDEVRECEKFLFRQLEAIRPRIVVALGGTALKCLLHDEEVRISRLRGTFTDYRGARLMPTFHPAYLLRNPEAKKDVWNDMKKVKAQLEADLASSASI